MIKYEKGTFGYYKELAKNDGFDNINEWNRWRIEQREKKEFYKTLEDKYGKEFAEWAKQNENKVQKYYINAGCKNRTEYEDYLARKRWYKDRIERNKKENIYIKRGFKYRNDYENHLATQKGFKDKWEWHRQWNYDNRNATPMSENEYCSSYFGIHIAERYVSATFEEPIRMPLNNPGFDWICKKGEKIQHKARCLDYSNRSPRWKFDIGYNNLTDYFILSGWSNRIDLEPVYVWLIHKNEIIRGKKFWRRYSISITNDLVHLAEFKKYEINDKLEKLKELCKKSKI